MALTKNTLDGWRGTCRKNVHLIIFEQKEQTDSKKREKLEKG